MRTTIWTSLIAASLVFGGGCRKKEDAEKAMDRAGVSAAKAQENVNEQARDVIHEEKDVTRDEKKLAKDQADVAREEHQLDSAERDLAQARERYRLAAKQRLEDLDVKIHELERQASAYARDIAAKLKVRRDELAARIDTIGDQVQANWDAFRKDLDAQFDKVEKEAREALHK